MTPESQRIAIAEACGWTRVPKVVDYIRSEPFDSWTTPDGEDMGIFGPAIPDYHNDLNAMHEAENVLDMKGVATVLYMDTLHKLVGYHSYDIAHATAAQRAEAFLRTLNLYDP